MIYVCQGDELGIGPEIIIRASLCLNQKQLDHFHFIFHPQTLENTLQQLKISYLLKNNILKIAQLKLKIIPLTDVKYSSKDHPTSQTLLAFMLAINHQDPRKIIINAPAGKDQFIYLNQKFLGHTEFLRHYFQDQSLPMFFNAPNIKMLLLTDHLDLKTACHLFEKLPSDFIHLISKKIETTLNFLKNNKYELKNLYFLGFNPHGGEGGLLGKTEIHFIKKMNLVNRLLQYYPDAQFQMIPADTIHHKKDLSSSLVISPYHDTGLIYFKSFAGNLGINTTLGLPFMRISVDHGTAKEIFGKNKANIESMLNCFQYSLKLIN